MHDEHMQVHTVHVVVIVVTDWNYALAGFRFLVFPPANPIATFHIANVLWCLWYIRVYYTLI